jgi:hypothetical protein
MEVVMSYGLEKPIPLGLNAKPTNCDWCSANLARLRNIYKGQGCQRHYCSQKCLTSGEDRAIRYRAALAGRVCSHYLVGAAILIAFMLTFTFTGGHRAWAHDPETHQANSLADAYSQAYGKCCTGDDYVLISTWERTDTGYRVMYQGQWLDVAQNVKVSNMVNPDGEAKAWIFGEPETPYVRCFMPGASS